MKKFFYGLITIILMVAFMYGMLLAWDVEQTWNEQHPYGPSYGSWSEF